MKLNGFQKWMLRQGLGRARYEFILSILDGPIGEMIDAVLQGRLSVGLSKLNEAQKQLEEIVSKYGIRLPTIP